MMDRFRRPWTGLQTLLWIVSHRLLRWAQHRPRDAGQVATGMVATLLLITIWIGCAPAHRPLPRNTPTTTDAPSRTTTPPEAKPRDPVQDLPLVREITGEPTVRVRTHRDARNVQLEGPLPLTVSPGFTGEARAKARVLRGQTTITRQPDGTLHLRVAGQHTLGWASDVLVIESRAGRVVVDGVTYPGRVLIHTDGSNTTAFDVVNHARIDDYLPGVLERELYADWHPEAYRAQAVAARSYAIAQSRGARLRGWHYDLESTTASQVYGGRGTRPVAQEAVDDTRGMVLTYDGRIVPGYYSSTVGPRGQDASAAFPRGEHITPLVGAAHANADTSSPHYRWGPVHRPTNQLARRLAAWGRANREPIAQLSGLSAITVTKRNRVGRPTRFVVTDAVGKRFDLGPEAFRFACNFSGGGLPPARGNDRVKSADLAATVGSTTVTIRGYGFGHGVGMSQFGAQQLATRGVRYTDILNRYYPRAAVQRVY